MKKISLFNLKNGVGKTTIGFALAKHLECAFIEVEKEYFKEIDVFNAEVIKKCKDKVKKDCRTQEFDTIKEQQDYLKKGFEDCYSKNKITMKKAYHEDMYEHIAKIENLKDEDFGGFFCGNDKVEIYDINTKDEEKIKSTLEDSDIIILPTCLDFKDISKTIDSLNLIKDIEKTKDQKIKVIVIFNKLNTDKNKEADLTKVAQEILQKTREDTTFLYIRESKLWYRGFFQGECYLDLFKKDSFYKNEDDVISTYFTNNKMIEIFYQYSYYYNIYYKALEEPKLEKLSIEAKINSITKSRIAFIKKITAINEILNGKNAYKGKDAKIRSIINNLNKPIELSYKIKDNEEENEIFLVSFDRELFDFIKESKVYSDIMGKGNDTTTQASDTYYNGKYYKRKIAEARLSYKITCAQFENSNCNLEEEIEKLDKKKYNLINIKYDKEQEKNYHLLILKEKIIHLYLTTFFNLQNISAGRKIFRDMKNLLIEIGEYGLDD
jgi:hypothetical protein